MERERRSAREIAAAVRELAREAAPPPVDEPAGPVGALVWVAADSPAGRAWRAWWIANKSRHGPPRDKAGGWFYPSQWPPNVQGAAAR